MAVCLFCGKEITKKQVQSASYKSYKEAKFCCYGHFVAYKNKDLPQVFCKTCGKQLTNKQVKKAQYEEREPKYCSQQCAYVDKERTGLSEESRNKISNALKGHAVSEVTRRRVGETQKGKIVSEATRNKMSQNRRGKPRSQEVVKKIRLAVIRRIENRKGSQVYPNWNPRACEYFEKWDIEHDTKGQHATNGGEYKIKELGYWVDYINHDMKIIMEYDEKHHYHQDKLSEKDMKRQIEIQNYFKDYTFIRIKEGEI